MSTDPRRRRLIYRASHRGMKEMDLILGTFAAERVPDMEEAELAQFEQLVEAADQLLYQWITGKAQAPADHATAMLDEVRRFCANPSGIRAGLDAQRG